MPPSDRPVPWLQSDRLLARRVAQPVQRFLRVEAAGGLLLVVATLVALVWANSPWSSSYTDLWETRAGVRIGGHALEVDLRHWVNDALMVLFFFVVGLEIKRELVAGELADARRAALPAVAALGGMVVPAAIYVAFNAGGPGADGWGIPMATDIAFAVGVFAVVGTRAPSGLKVLLLGLAVVDDIGAIVVIAVFYADGVELVWAILAVVGIGAVVVLTRIGVRATPVYVVVGAGVWLATFESGIHATIAGVALGLLAPARPLADRGAVPATAWNPAPGELRGAAFELRETVSVAERLQHLLHPWTSYVVVPVFALANAGVVLSTGAIRDAATSRITLGVVAGLVVGKFVGITAAIALARRLRIASLPRGVTMRHVAGMAAIAGIGFTVSLFVTGLAFDGAQADEAKLGVLAASVLAALVGTVLLRRLPANAGDGDP